MPLSTAEKTQLQSDAQAITDAVNALVVDTVDVAQLQADLAKAQSDLATADATIASMQTKIDAAKAAAQADKDADAANAAGQGVLDALA